jgi:hypothetical protein
VALSLLAVAAAGWYFSGPKREIAPDVAVDAAAAEAVASRGGAKLPPRRSKPPAEAEQAPAEEP